MNKNKVVSVGLLILFKSFFPIFAARPTVTFKAVPTSINRGGSSILTWTSTNATSASINQGIGSVPINGSRTVSPTTTITYTITVKNAAGTKVTAMAKVTVKPALPIVTFNASPSSLSQGQSSTLSWTTSNATSASINQGIGSIALNGSKTVTPTVTTTYTLTATGSGGTVTATSKITLSVAPPTVTFSAAPTTIEAGQNSTLSWTTSNATSVSIDQGIGAVSTNGSISIHPLQTTLYTMTIAGPGGSATGYTQVTVVSKPVITFSVMPKIITPGASATLSWDCINAANVSIDNDIGDVPLNGTRSVSPVKTTTYTIMASGSGGIATAIAIVIVGSDRQGVLFANNNSGANVRVLDANTGDLLNTIAIPATNIGLWGVECDPSGSFIYVANNGAKKIHRIDPLTMSLKGEVGISGSTKFLTAAPDGRYIYATISNGYYYNQWVSPLSIISTYKNDMALVKTLFIPGDRAYGLAVDADSSRVYVSLGSEDKVAVLNAATLQQSLTYDMDISDDLLDEYELLSPGEIAVSPNKHELYVLNYNGMAVFDTNNGTLKNNIDVHGYYIKVSPDGGNIYVMDYYNGLSVIETAGLTIVKSNLPIGQYPSQTKCLGLSVHPDGSRLYVVKEKIYVIETETYSVITTMASGSSSWYYGNFVSYLPLTISGKVTQDSSGLANVKVFLDGEGIARSLTTSAEGRYIFAAKEGGNKVTPEYQALMFTPESLTLTVNGHLTNQDFVVSGIVRPPTVALTSSSTWVKIYESFTLNWNSTGADYVTLELVTSDHLPPSGSRTFALQSTSTIWAVAHNRGGTASASVMIYVSDTTPPTASINASPSSILQGNSSTLTWATTKASTITIDNGIGTVAAVGSKVVSPSATTTYTITVTHSNGYRVTSSATVEVIPVPLPTITLAAAPEMLAPGGSSTLTWASTNATSVTIDNGIGAIDLNGTRTVSPTQDTVYIAIATGPGGTATASVKIKMLNTHLQEIWGGMKMAIFNQNIDSAIAFFSTETQSKYREILTDLQQSLPQIASEMREIEPIEFDEGSAQYRIKRQEVIKGTTYDITFYIYFVQDEDETWKILKF